MAPRVETYHSPGYALTAAGNVGETDWRKQQEMLRLQEAYSKPQQVPPPQVDPRMLSGVYHQMQQPDFTMPPPYANQIPRDIPQWPPAAQASLISLLLQRAHQRSKQWPK